ncbi:MAG: hypothetical protein QOF57_2361 [Frankiaceae bacterium]|nr:hypothetical protein [Frankiaceae bacterium]
MPVILAHGVGIRADLPISRQLFVVNGALVVVATFVVLAGFWQRSRLRGNAAGVPLPSWLQTVIDAGITRVSLRLAVLAVTAFVLVVGAVGPSAADRNLAPQVLFITFWVGLVPASLLLGPVWRAVNPLRTVHAAWARAAGVSADDGFRQLPARVGYWPAAVSLFVFVSFELVIPNHAVPFHVAIFLVVYALVQLVGAFLYGSDWFARADGFEVYSTLIGRMAFLGRREDGRLVLRSPFNGLDGTLALPGLVGFVVVLLGSTAFDGVERTAFWQRQVSSSVLLGFGGLIGMILVVGALYYAATRAAELLGGVAVDLPAALAHSLIPIAVGYSVAHYFSLLIFDGQTTWILASNPFQHYGTDYFGTATNLPDYTVLSSGAVSAIRAGAIVGGHVLGTIAAHDRVLRLLPPRRATRAQLPLLVLMVLFTMGGLLLILA